jgi:hypothetical protein
MPNLSPMQHSNPFSTKSPCPYCQGVQQHETWCVTVNLSVRYAYEVVLGSAMLTAGDVLILHSLGVIW